MLDASPVTSSFVVFNGKQFRLDGHKEKDEAATAEFLEKKLLPRDASVMRTDALLTEKHTGEKNPFRLWYDANAERTLPLRFEYQAKPFLRLTFDADANADTPPVRFVFKQRGTVDQIARALSLAAQPRSGVSNRSIAAQPYAPFA